jgi:hypothetical protein
MTNGEMTYWLLGVHSRSVSMRTQLSRRARWTAQPVRGAEALHAVGGEVARAVLSHPEYRLSQTEEVQEEIESTERLACPTRSLSVKPRAKRTTYARLAGDEESQQGVVGERKGHESRVLDPDNNVAFLPGRLSTVRS